MNVEQVNGILRIVVPMVCTFLAAHWLPKLGDSNVVAQITAAVIGVAAAFWSYFSHSNAALLQQAAKLNPDIIIKVPERIILKDAGVASVVNNTKRSNVTKQD